MANYVANVRKPFYNIQQLIVTARSGAVRTSADIILPNYISDRRVVAGIMYSNLAYLRGIASLEPSYPERYYYLEKTSCSSPLIQKIYIAPWIGYALLYKKPKVIEMLLQNGCSIFQKMVTIEYKILTNGVYTIFLQESACVLLLYQWLESSQFEELKHLIPLLKKFDVNLEKPLDVKTQLMDQNSILNNESMCYHDMWEFLVSRTERLPPSMKDQRIILLEEVKKTVNNISAGPVETGQNAQISKISTHSEQNIPPNSKQISDEQPMIIEYGSQQPYLSQESPMPQNASQEIQLQSHPPSMEQKTHSSQSGSGKVLKSNESTHSVQQSENPASIENPPASMTFTPTPSKTHSDPPPGSVHSEVPIESVNSQEPVKSIHSEDPPPPDNAEPSVHLTSKQNSSEPPPQPVSKEGSNEALPQVMSKHSSNEQPPQVMSKHSSNEQPPQVISKEGSNEPPPPDISKQNSQEPPAKLMSKQSSIEPPAQSTTKQSSNEVPVQSESQTPLLQPTTSPQLEISVNPSDNNDAPGELEQKKSDNKKPDSNIEE